MGMVKVWNDNKFDYEENFKGDLIRIPAGKYVEMESGEAHLFKGSFKPPKLNHDGKDDPRGYKMIRVEGEVEIPEERFICPITGQEFPSQPALNKHLEQYKDRVYTDPEAEAVIKKKRGRPRKTA